MYGEVVSLAILPDSTCGPTLLHSLGCVASQPRREVEDDAVELPRGMRHRPPVPQGGGAVEEVGQPASWGVGGGSRATPVGRAAVRWRSLEDTAGDDAPSAAPPAARARRWRRTPSRAGLLRIRGGRVSRTAAQCYHGAYVRSSCGRLRGASPPAMGTNHFAWGPESRSRRREP